MIRQPMGSIIKIGKLFGCFPVRHMHDQRVEIGSPLCGIDFGNGACVAGIRRKAIDRLGRYSDDSAHLQLGRRLGNGQRVGRNYPAFTLGI